MKPLVVITQVREIPECVASWRELSTPVVCLRGYPMIDLPPVMAELVAATDHDPILMCADDCIVTQEAVDAVLDLLGAGHPVVTGWCRLDRTHELANLCTEPLPAGPPTREHYTFPTAESVITHPDPAVPTHFVGMALTGMSRAMWERFPLDGWTDRNSMWATDHHLSGRLSDAGIPMVAAREGFVDHVKERWMEGDLDPRKRILIGSMPKEVAWCV